MSKIELEGVLSSAKHTLQRNTHSAAIVFGTYTAGSRGGLRVLEWTGKLVPQGLLVKGVPLDWSFIAEIR